MRAVADDDGAARPGWDHGQPMVVDSTTAAAGAGRQTSRFGQSAAAARASAPRCFVVQSQGAFLKTLVQPGHLSPQLINGLLHLGRAGVLPGDGLRLGMAAAFGLRLFIRAESCRDVADGDGSGSGASSPGRSSRSASKWTSCQKSCHSCCNCCAANSASVTTWAVASARPLRIRDRRRLAVARSSIRVDGIPETQGPAV